MARSTIRHVCFVEKKLAAKPDLTSQKELENASLKQQGLVSLKNPTPTQVTDPDLIKRTGNA